MFTIVLVAPKIPQNTGNIGRLCAANEATLHIVGDIGFDLSDTALKRAGLDYWPYLKWERFPDEAAYLKKLPKERCHLLTTKSTCVYTDQEIKAGDYLIFGNEIAGVSDEIRDDFSEQCCTIPMKSSHVRSLNLSNAVSIVLYEGIRQVSVAALSRV